MTRLPRFAACGLAALSCLALGCQPAADTETTGAADATLTANSTADDATDHSNQESKLIPRSVLFGNPQRASARISPNGKWLSYLAPADGKLNVWVAPIDDLAAAKQVTNDKKRDIRMYSWAYNGDYILYSQDTGGDEDWHVYATEVATNKTTDLTPVEKVHAQIEGVSEKFPDEILVGLNDRDPAHHDIYRVNIKTGERKLIQENAGVAGYITDDDFKVRFLMDFTAEGGTELKKPKDPDAKPGDKGISDWEDFLTVGPEDAMTTSPAGFNKEGDVLYMLDSRGRNTGALFALNLKTGDKKLVAENDKADVGEVLTHPTEKNIQAVGFTYSRREWTILDDEIKSDLDYLAKVEDGELVVTSRTLDDKKWVVAYLLDNGPVKYYLYDRSDKDNLKTKFLFANRDDFEGYPLVKMHTPVIKTRDGKELVSYLSLPPGSDPDGDGKPDHPVPLILNVHGGPWARDEWGFDAEHQWLANRGYAVLAVNYRGSTGFGKDFVNAANSEWAGKMHDDLIDAVDWAVKEGVAEKDKIAIMGGSYGGYATLVGMTYTPDVFACGVDIVGPSSLVTLLENVPPYWIPFMPVMKVRVGDVETEEGRAALLKRSPLGLVHQIKKPLLIGQGANDPRVKQQEADQIVKAMQEKNIPVTYVLYPDEGHGFGLEPNRMSFNAVAEAFLAEHLGGRFEPIGDDFEHSSIHIPAGADQVPGVEEALPKDRFEMPKSKEKKPAEAEA